MTHSHSLRALSRITGLFLLLFSLAPISTPAQEADKKFNSMEEAMAAFQNDADLARLEHLVYWTGLIEEYESKAGRFPFADKPSAENSTILVRVATFAQSKYFNPESSQYISQLDNNSNGRFHELTTSELVAELERGLGRPIDEKYDIQYAPTRSPVWYNYFVTDTGYLFWVTCTSCGVTKISTLLFDGLTPTVNITSSGMKDSVTKALPRTEMLAHPIFLRWKSKDFIQESFVRQREELHYHDFKMRHSSPPP